jgi:hypothetical protein
MERALSPNMDLSCPPGSRLRMIKHLFEQQPTVRLCWTNLRCRPHMVASMASRAVIRTSKRCLSCHQAKC